MSRKEPAAKPEEDFSAQRNAAYDYVDRVFKIEEIYGERGSQIVQRLAARASTPAMPLGLSLQIALCSCANGAVVEAFPGSSSPLSLIALNCNVTQTRKSQLTQVLDDISAVIDEACQRRARAAWSRGARETYQCHVGYVHGAGIPPTLQPSVAAGAVV